MSRDQLMLGLLAAMIGIATVTALFVPFVAASYRRHGGFSLRRGLLWAAVIVYLWGVWAYVLLPFPDPDTLTCAGSNLRPFGFVADLTDSLRGASGSPVALLTNAVVLQVVLNVLLFVPLGVFVRLLGGRGVLAATVAGLVTSGLVEVTQLTGVWGLYDCAYRVFDVDDLGANTIGAAIGSLLAWPLGRNRGEPVAPQPANRPVTRPRRLLGMACDWLGFTLTGVAVSVAVQAFLLYVRHDRAAVVEGTIASWLGPVVALACWLAVTLATGRSIGDLAIGVRYLAGSQPDAGAGLLRWLTGVGGYGLLQFLPRPWTWLAWLFAVSAVAATLLTAHGRGLPGLALRRSPVSVVPQGSVAGSGPQDPDT